MSKTDEITNSEDVIDSRDIIERLEYLESEMTDFQEKNKLPLFDYKNDWQGSEYDEWDKKHKKHDRWWAATKWNDAWEYAEEYRSLKTIADECEGVSGWQYGEILIRDTYWQSYIEELIEDCYMTKETRDMISNWPWRHLDMEAAAEEAKVDYMSVDFNGVDYWIRSC